MPRPRSPRRFASALLALLVSGAMPEIATAVPDDAYIAGYVAAVLERQLGVSPRSVRVKDGVVTIDGADVPRADRPKVLTAVTAIRGVSRVDVVEGPAAAAPPPSGAAVPPAPPTSAAPDLGFLPTGHLFHSLIADPRWPHFSAAYRYYITTPGPRDVAAVSFGETIPFYRDELGEKGRWGQWELGLQGGVFSTFDLGSSSIDLINTDFFVAGFVGYRNGNVSALGRVFHQSSHLGDELLLRETRPNRVNLSYEGFDAKLSYDLPFGFRGYGGGGYLFDVDPSNLGRGLAQAGAEWRSPKAFWRERLRPVAGIDLQWHEENGWSTDLSLRAGIQLESVTVLSRNLQLLVEYYNGRSVEGQFFKDSVEYVGIGAHFHF